MRYKGGLTKGKSHAEGGIKMKVASTGQNIEVEGGEVIVNKKNVADPTKLEFEGEQKTTCEILSDLNSRNGNGVTLECDSVEGKKYKHEKGGKLPKDDTRLIIEVDYGSYTENIVVDKNNVEEVANYLMNDLSIYEATYVSGDMDFFEDNIKPKKTRRIQKILDWEKQAQNFEEEASYGTNWQKREILEKKANLFNEKAERGLSKVNANELVYYGYHYGTMDLIHTYLSIDYFADSRYGKRRFQPEKKEKEFKKGGKLPKENMENNSDYDTYLDNKKIDLFAEYGVKISNIKDLENSLGINRENMPQIRSFHFNDFLEQLDEDNIKHSYEIIESKKLKPTQSQVNVDKADKLTKEFVDARFLIASNDNYILDGHHRWYYGIKNDGISKVLRIDMPIDELIDYAKAFDKTQYSDIYHTSQFKKGGEISNIELFKEVREKLVPSQQVDFLMEMDDPTESRDMLSNVVKAYEDIPSLYEQDAKGYNAVAYLHYFVGGSDWWITEYDKSTGKMRGFVKLNGEWQNSEFGNIDSSFFKENSLSPLQKPELDFYFKYQTINEILEKEYPAKVKPPILTYEDLKNATHETLGDKLKVLSIEKTIGGTDWQNLIEENSFKNPFEKVKAIERMIDEKGENPNNYSVIEKKFLTEYTGIGGMEKYGAKARDVGMGKESDYGLLYEFFTPDSLCRIMWGLAYKHSGDMEIKDVLEPSMGAGAFIGQAPINVNVDGYDINKYCYMINKILYTEERFKFYHDSFEKLFIKNNRSVMGDVTPMYDLVIGNPPYGTYQGEYAVLGNAKSEKKHTKADNFIDYFISRGLDLLRPNGLLVYVIGSLPVFGSLPFLETEMKSSKRKIMSKCDLVDAYRLGTSMFEFTKVDADIIVLRKK
tara:strand:+ start:241 stop:2883 length:2643 start_codon:yes stop_codon:yes gene_type:complete